MSVFRLIRNQKTYLKPGFGYYGLFAGEDADHLQRAGVVVLSDAEAEELMAILEASNEK